MGVNEVGRSGFWQLYVHRYFRYHESTTCPGVLDPLGSSILVVHKSFSATPDALISHLKLPSYSLSHKCSFVILMGILILLHVVCKDTKF